MENVPKEPFNIDVFLRNNEVTKEELRQIVLDNLEDILDSLPKVDLSEVVGKLEDIEDGLYQCNQPPDIEFLKNENNFNDNFEIGVYKIKGKWLLNISHSLSVSLPVYLESIQTDRLFEVHMHSHPRDNSKEVAEDGLSMEVPGYGDDLELRSTVDGYCYILSILGVKSFHLPSEPPEGFRTIEDTDKAFTIWISDKLKTSKNYRGEFSMDDLGEREYWELQKKFYEKYFGLVNIPWNKEEEIKKILQL